MTATKDFASVPLASVPDELSVDLSARGSSRIQGFGFGSVVQRTLSSLGGGSGRTAEPRLEPRIEPEHEAGQPTVSQPMFEPLTADDNPTNDPVSDPGDTVGAEPSTPPPFDAGLRRGTRAGVGRLGLTASPGNSGSRSRSDSPLSGDRRTVRRPIARLTRIGARNVGISLAVLGVMGSAMATWIAYQASVDNRYAGGVPVVASIDDPTKERPEDAGGLAVPDQDMLVFERLNANSDAPGVERLLPAAEEPIALVGLDAGAAPAPADNGPVPQAVPQVQAPVAVPLPTQRAPEPIETAPAVTAPVESATSEPAPLETVPASEETGGTEAAVARVLESLLAEDEEIAAAPPPVSTAGAIPARTWRIQLASLRHASETQGAWQRLQARNDAVLGSLSLSVQEAELETGTFYRIQAGPLADRAAADAACAALTANDQACFVVAP